MSTSAARAAAWSRSTRSGAACAGSSSRSPRCAPASLPTRIRPRPISTSGTWWATSTPSMHAMASSSGATGRTITRVSPSPRPRRCMTARSMFPCLRWKSPRRRTRPMSAAPSAVRWSATTPTAVSVAGSPTRSPRHPRRRAGTPPGRRSSPPPARRCGIRRASIPPAAVSTWARARTTPRRQKGTAMRSSPWISPTALSPG